MPAPLPGSELSTQRAVTLPAVETPNIQPRQGDTSQCPPNAAYTTPSISSSPGRCCWVVGLNDMLGMLSALPLSCTGKPVRRTPVVTSRASMYQAADPEVPVAYVL